MKNIVSISFLILLFFSAQAQKKSKVDVDKEDFSIYRPRFEYSPDSVENTASNIDTVKNQKDILDDSSALFAVLDSISSLNANIEYVKVFKVLAYSGTDREKGMKIRKTILEEYPEWKVELSYKQPYFKVMIGAFTQRVDAIRTNHLIQEIELKEEEYPDMEKLHPLVVPDKQKIR